jgi:5'-methylthioinosine phosphorylase
VNHHSRRIAIICGTGLAQGLGTFLSSQIIQRDVVVRFGSRVGRVLYYVTGEFKDLEVIVIPRHGPNLALPDRSPAELVNELGHEAHIWLLHEMGVDAVYAFNSVGALDLNIPLAADRTFLIPDNFGRGFSTVAHSFGHLSKTVHPSMARPFASRLREVLRIATESCGARAIMTGLYINSTGDAFETSAEVRAYRNLYKDEINRVVGMTSGAEIGLCRQMQIDYGLICANCNRAEGLDPDHEVDHPFVLKGMMPAVETLAGIAERVIRIEAEAKIRLESVP